MRFTQRLTAYLRVTPGARRNRLDLTRYLVRRPAIAVGVGTYELGLLLSNRVETRTKALAALKTASLVGCEFCLDIGSATGRWLGIKPDDLVALATYTHSPAFTGRERLAIELAESLTQTPAGVTEELRARLGQEFSAAQIMELAAEIAWENHRGRLNQGIGVRPMGFAEGAACLRPAALSTGTAGQEA